MSAFNLARYNLAQYNVARAAEIWASGAASIAFRFAYAGQTHYAQGTTAVRFNVDTIKMDRGRFASGSQAITFRSSSAVNGYYWRHGIGAAAFDDTISISQIAYPTGDTEIGSAAEINLSQIAYAEGDSAVESDAALNLSQLVYTSGDAGEVFTSTVDVAVLSESVCSFPGLTLKPGQSLIIDAGAYNVLLDGKNAIHYQKGDWLDNLSQNTQQITASATGINRLRIQILYVERYL